LLDATDMVNCVWPGTGGGAHSDIFDAPVGKLFWQLTAAAKP
jgi:hypothetical protein